MSPMSPEEDSPFGRSPFSSGDSDFSSGAPEIGYHEIKKGKLLGKGSFAQVYAGLCRGLPVAIKVRCRDVTCVWMWYLLVTAGAQ